MFLLYCREVRQTCMEIRSLIHAVQHIAWVTLSVVNKNKFYRLVTTLGQSYNNTLKLKL
jgi:hypothetical protein